MIEEVPERIAKLLEQPVHGLLAAVVVATPDETPWRLTADRQHR